MRRRNVQRPHTASCNVACSLLLPLFISLGCGDESSADGSNGSNDDAQASSTDAPTGDSDDTAGTDAPDMPEDPPDIECGDGTHKGAILIDPDDPAGVSVETLDGIAILDGDLLISSTNYRDLSFLACLKEVRGDVKIYDNAFLESTAGTDGITKIGRLPAPNPTAGNPNYVDEGKGAITISNNPVLVDIDGFGGIAEVGERDAADPELESSQSLVIRNNEALETITGFGNLEIIFDSLVIQENPALKDIDGLRGLKVIDGFFSVTRNESLCSSSVTAVGAGLQYLGDREHSTDTQNDDSC